jgi:hypothetical protein
MTPVDIAVYSGLAAVALYPFAGPALAKLKSLKPSKVAEADDGPALTRQWADTLICLIEEIEGGELPLANDKESTRLARQLIWQLIGGEDE